VEKVHKSSMKGKVESYLNKLKNEGIPIHFSLIDPAKVKSYDELRRVAKMLYDAGTSAFLVGGTLGISKDSLDNVVEVLKEFDIPIIIFPSNINLITEKADAILFLSLLNSDELYYVVGAQIVAAPLIKRAGLEVLPTAYLIIGYGGTAGHVGRARVIPYDNYELAVAYSLAAEMMGMRYVYLEAGSGAPESVRPQMVSEVSKNTEITVIVGGGIKDPEKAKELFLAGAHIIVTGNIIEYNYEKAIKIIQELCKVRKNAS